MAEHVKKVKKPKTTDSKHANASNWRAEDEITLRYAIDGQLQHLDEQILKANSPAKKSKLRDRKKELKAMRKKVDNGIYGSTSLYAQLNRMGIKVDAEKAGKGSVSRYDTMDFKFDEYFRKTRYYGGILPFLLILFIALMFLVLSLGSILPATVDSALNPAPAEGEEVSFSMHIDSLYMFKLSNTNDFLIKNDGKWPAGLWAEGKQLEEGVLYTDASGNAPATVRVYAELGMTAIKISVWDVANAFFRTALSSYRIDPIEDLAVFDGADWFYAKYIMNKDDLLTFGKQADGTYNYNNLIYIIAVYGTIAAVVGLFVTAICGIVSSIVSMFTYTGRRLHFYAVFMIIFLAAALILPAFLGISAGTEPADCLNTYFLFNDSTFLSSETNASITVNLPLIIAFLPAVFVLILPKLFKNRASKLPTYVPKGNRPPTPALVERAMQNGNGEGSPAYGSGVQRTPYPPRPRPAMAQAAPAARPVRGVPTGRPMGAPPRPTGAGVPYGGRPMTAPPPNIKR